MNGQTAAREVLASLQARIGQEIHCSDWLDVTQQRVNEFAQATGDHQWIHVDPERAARESPWQTTIAHGYLTLSLYPLLRGLVDAATPLFPGVTRVINYGLDKLRFPNAVKVGSKVRARCVLLKVEEVAGGLQLTEQYTVEIAGEAKPACVAEAIMRVYF
jgi:acyl dehydratase